MKKKVLLIDDSMTIHRVIDLSVDEEKYEVEKVFTAEDAENKLRTFSPDIVLLDNKLEGIKLDEFVSKIKSEIGASVVLLVGAFDHFSEGNLSATNADDFIVKPFNSSLLDEKLDKFSMVSTDQIQEVPAEKEAEKDEAVEELLASIDTDEKDFEENKFEDFNDILGDEEISKSEEDVISETESDEKIPEESEADEKLDLELEEAFSEIEEKPEESLQESEELNIEKDDFEDIFETAVDDKKGFEQDFEPMEKIEETELSEDILTDIVEESDEDLKDTEEIKPEESEIDDEDIFGELEEVSEESDIDKLLMDEEDLAAEKVESEVDGTDVAQEITVDEVESDEIKEELLKEDEIEEQPDVVSEEVSEADSSTVPEGLDRETVKAVIEEAIDLDFIRDTVREVLSKNLEKVIWEIVPDMAEKLIVEEIEKLKKGE
jgi:DNA-binding response OmpR family regulator